MAKQVFFGAPLTNSYSVIDNGVSGNTGDQNGVNPPGTGLAGAGGYDNTSGTLFGGAIFQGLAAVSAANGSIPDYLVSPKKTVTPSTGNAVLWSNPS